MPKKYSENIMRKVRQNLDLEPDDTSKDHIIESMSQDEVFDRVLTWEGMIGYSQTIKGWVSQIYKVTL